MKPPQNARPEDPAPTAQPKSVDDPSSPKTARNVRLVVLAVAVALAGLFVFRQYPHWVASWYVSGARQHWIEGQHEAALADVQTAIEWEPDRADLFVLRAQIHHHNGDAEAALGDWNHILDDLNKDFMAGYAQRSLIYQLLDRHKEALADAKKYAAWLGPDSAHGLNHYAYSRAVANDDLKTAMTDAEKAITLVEAGRKKEESAGKDSSGSSKVRQSDYDLSGYLDTRGYLHLRFGAHDQAVTDLTRAIELATKVRDAMVEQAQKLSDAERAFAEYQANAPLRIMYQHRGLAHKALDKAADAETDFAKAKALGYDRKVDGQ